MKVPSSFVGEPGDNLKLEFRAPMCICQIAQFAHSVVNASGLWNVGRTKQTAGKRWIGVTL